MSQIKDRYLIIVLAEPGTQDSLGRVAHALIYANDLLEKGFETKILFDGGGTKWIQELTKNDHPLNSLFNRLKEKEVIDGVCEHCITVFKADIDIIRRSGVRLIGEFHGHPSISKYIENSYRVMIF